MARVRAASDLTLCARRARSCTGRRASSLKKQVIARRARGYDQAMAASQAAQLADEILLDTRSPDAATVTHVRGSVLSASLQHLRNTGVYDRFRELSPPRLAESLESVIAASWVPIEQMMRQLEICDALGLPETVIAEQGALVGGELGAMIYGAFLRTTRNLGADAGWIILKQSGRFMQRVYKGGGCTLYRTGPKDALLELDGLPMVSSRYFRISHHAYMRALGKMMGSASYVKAARARVPHPARIASSFSWV